MTSDALHALMARLKPSRILIGNAGSLVVGSVANAVLGFAYWALAARSFSPEAVGYASAAISLMSFVALVGEFGLGTLVLGEIQHDLKHAPRLISASLIAALALSLLCGLLAIAACNVMAIDLGAILNTRGGGFAFAVACAASGFALVLD
jgi:O-antigen/teichoic acid export membrane protein